jgi:uncharacterized membrane protein YkvA (DUF1232 family)
MGTEQRGSHGHDEPAVRQRRVAGQAPGDVALSTLSEEDLHRIEDRAESLKQRFAADGPLARFVNDFRNLGEMFGEIVQGRYRHVPGWAIFAIGAATLYALNPFDLVPDVVPLLGVLDDATVIAACMLLVEHELQRWRSSKMLMDE